MTLRTTAAALALMTTAVSAPAMAQTTPDWTGPYVGVFIGGNQANDQGDERLRFDRNLDGNYGETVSTAAGADAFGSPPARWSAHGFLGPAIRPLPLPLQPTQRWGEFYGEQRILHTYRLGRNQGTFDEDGDRAIDKVSTVRFDGTYDSWELTNPKERTKFGGFLNGDPALNEDVPRWTCTGWGRI